jgi:hypothetical protein
MTHGQLEAIEQVKRHGYTVEFDRWQDNGIMRVAVVRRERAGVMHLLVRPNGEYRDSRYDRWHNT